MKNRVTVMHGVNLDQLGRRDPEQYGNFTLPELDDMVDGWARERGLQARFFQTNYEGAWIEHLHDLEGMTDALIMNPGAWTHYAWAIRDALEIVGLPTVEVHLSDVHNREAWRAFSVLDGLCVGQVAGKGAEGYREALDMLAPYLDPPAA